MNKELEFILEIGVNHNNEVKLARELILAAKKSGAKIVKFQSYTAEKIAALNSPSYWDLNEEKTTSQRELFKKYDSFTESDYLELFELCNDLGIEFMSTCFDQDWVDKLDKYLKRYKIASADVTNYQLIAHIAKKNKPIILSTGASTFAEINAAIQLIQSYTKAKITLLHCVLNYPTDGIDANLLRLQQLSNEFPDFETGYSDHTRPEDSHQAIVLARALGATVIEKHFTSDKSQKGNDHYHAFDQDDVRRILATLSQVDKMLDFNEDKFIGVQENARRYARRGLYAETDIETGNILTDSSIRSLRPVPEGGLEANQIHKLIGRKANKPIKKGEPIFMTDTSA
jgi:sialic acid synthase SpsE